jgi:hypothetical protein
MAVLPVELAQDRGLEGVFLFLGPSQLALRRHAVLHHSGQHTRSLLAPITEVLALGQRHRELGEEARPHMP